MCVMGIFGPFGEKLTPRIDILMQGTYNEFIRSKALHDRMVFLQSIIYREGML